MDGAENGEIVLLNSTNQEAALKQQHRNATRWFPEAFISGIKSANVILRQTFPKSLLHF